MLRIQRLSVRLDRRRDNQVVLRQRRGRYHSETRRHILHRGWSKPRSVREDAYGQPAGIHLARRDHKADSLGISVSTQSYGTPLRLKKSRMVYPAEDARLPTRTT